MMMVLVQRMTLFAWTRFDLAAAAQAKGEAKPAMPSLWTFLGYSFFLPTFLTGPALPFASYQHFTVAPLPKGRFGASIKTFLLSVLFLIIYVTLGSRLSYALLLLPGSAERPFWSRLIFLNLAGFLARTKYYAVWFAGSVVLH